MTTLQIGCKYSKPKRGEQRGKRDQLYNYVGKTETRPWFDCGSSLTRWLLEVCQARDKHRTRKEIARLCLRKMKKKTIKIMYLTL